jgi:hypothetical protein
VPAIQPSCAVSKQSFIQLGLTARWAPKMTLDPGNLHSDRKIITLLGSSARGVFFDAWPDFLKTRKIDNHVIVF